MRSTNVPQAVYDDVKALDGGCAWCHSEGDHTNRDVQFHHRIPRSRAKNLHDRFNGVMLCLDHHARAHAENVWPWLVGGSMLRGRYIGADPFYEAVYEPGATVEMLPSLEYVRGFYDVAPEMYWWLLGRARGYLSGIGAGG